MGYHIHKINEHNRYLWNCPYLNHTYAPFFEDWFQKIYNPIKNITVVTEDRCYIIYQFCKNASNVEGDFAECGVYKGGTAIMIANILKENKIPKQLHLFDTFTGMPSAANDDPSFYKEGDHSDTSLESVKKNFKSDDKVVFHPGLIPDTFVGVKEKRFSFVHIDVDIYKSTWDSLNFFYERMTRGGIMIFDDYGWPVLEQSERKAVDEFFKDKPESPISLRTGQALVIKL